MYIYIYVYTYYILHLQWHCAWSSMVLKSFIAKPYSMRRWDLSISFVVTCLEHGAKLHPAQQPRRRFSPTMFGTTRSIKPFLQGNSKSM